VNSKIALSSCSIEDANDFDAEDLGGEGAADSTDAQWDVDVVGPQGKGKVWQPDDDDDFELFAWGHHPGCVSDTDPVLPSFDDEEDTEEEEPEGDEDDDRLDEDGDSGDEIRGSGRGGAGAAHSLSGGGIDSDEGESDFEGEILDLIRERVVSKFDSGDENKVRARALSWRYLARFTLYRSFYSVPTSLPSYTLLTLFALTQIFISGQ
jgi:hypothetical protein